MEMLCTALLYGGFLLFDYAPGRKRRERRVNAVGLALYAVSLAATVWALRAIEIPALTELLNRFGGG